MTGDLFDHVGSRPGGAGPDGKRKRAPVREGAQTENAPVRARGAERQSRENGAEGLGEKHAAFISSLPCLRCYVQFRLHAPAEGAVPAPGVEGERGLLPFCAFHAPSAKAASSDGASSRAGAVSDCAHSRAGHLFERLGIDVKTLCADLYARSGDRDAAERAFRKQANRARRFDADAAFPLLKPGSEEAKKIAAQFAREAGLRV